MTTSLAVADAVGVRKAHVTSTLRDRGDTTIADLVPTGIAGRLGTSIANLVDEPG